MLLGIVLGVSLLGLVVAVLLARWVLAQDQGPDAMQKIAGAIRSGAEAFLRRQNTTIVKIAVPLAALIWILYFFVRTPTQFDPAEKGTLALWTTLSFVLGIGLGCSQPMIMSLLYSTAPPGRQGEAVGLRTTVLNASHTALPLVFGALGSVLGMGPVYWCMAGLLGTGGYFINRRRNLG